MSAKRPLTRVALWLIRLFAGLVPRESRDDWRAEWEAEVLHGAGRIEREGAGLAAELALLRRVGGALPDAAWLRRQVSADSELLQDLRHGWRTLLSEARFSVPAVSVLALGLGAATALFALADRLLLQPLPYPDEERVVTLWQQRGDRAELEEVAPANALDWRERARSFSAMAALIPSSYDDTGGTEPAVLFANRVTEGFLDVLGVTPLLGRPLLPADHQSGKHRVCLVSHGLWQRRFGGDRGVLGRRLELDGAPYEIVGVLPADFDPGLLPASGPHDLWTPYTVGEDDRETRGSAWWNAVARLAPGVSLEQAQAEMDAISAGLAREHPLSNESLRARLVPLRDHMTRAVRPALGLMAAAVMLLVVVVWANAAGLLLARGARRERELAIRASLGAGRGRLLRQLLTETGLLALLGAGLAWWLGALAVKGIVALSPADVPRLAGVHLDLRAAGFLAALAGATALVCGLPPALRLSAPRPERLRESGRSGTIGRSALRSGLVVAEVALALVLLVSAGLVTRSLLRLRGVDPGFRAEGVAALQVFVWDRNGSALRQRAFFDRTLEQLRALPGVRAAGIVSRMPFIEANIEIRSPIHVEGEPPTAPGREPSVALGVADEGAFAALGVPLLEGRLFRRSDRDSDVVVVVVNESLARRHLGGRALGRRLRLRWHGQALVAEVVGVVGSMRHTRLDGAPAPEAFLSAHQAPYGSMTYVLSTAADPARLVEAGKRAIWSVDPHQPFYRTATLTELVDRSVADRRFLSAVLATFAGMALLLTASGLFALISLLGAERAHEFGIRRALGAGAGAIAALVLGQALRLALPGVAIGLVLAAAAGPAMAGALYELSPLDPTTVAGTSAVLLLVALLAAWGPARRALARDPAAALRQE